MKDTATTPKRVGHAAPVKKKGDGLAVLPPGTIAPVVHGGRAVPVSLKSVSPARLGMQSDVEAAARRTTLISGPSPITAPIAGWTRLELNHGITYNLLLNVAGYKIAYPRGENTPGSRLFVFPDGAAPATAVPGYAAGASGLLASGSPGFVICPGGVYDKPFAPNTLTLRRGPSTTNNFVVYIATSPHAEWHEVPEDAHGAPPSELLAAGADLSAVTAAPATAGAGYAVDRVARMTAMVVDTTGDLAGAAGLQLRPWWYLPNADPSVTAYQITEQPLAAEGWIPDNARIITVAANERVFPFEVNVRSGGPNSLGFFLASLAQGLTGLRFYLQAISIPATNNPKLFLSAEYVP